MPWKFHSRNSDFEPEYTNQRFISGIVLQQNARDPANILTAIDRSIDESYTLTITDSGEVNIIANTSIGISRGLVTFTQLFYAHSAGGTYTSLAPVSIQDAPMFSHRGLNMDLSRNYFPVETIYQTIDALAYNKFNRFHLHITDGQSWPLVIPALPDLSAKGAYRPDLVYSPEDIQNIQWYGARQGVQVYLEIDMPGHTSSIAYSYPDLIASFNIQPDWNTNAAEPPSGTLKLNSSSVDAFIEVLFRDILPRVQPYTGFWHSGGDEVNLNAYLNDETVKSNDMAVLRPYVQRLMDRVHSLVRQAGLTPMVWEEMLLQWNLTLGDDVVVQTWQSDAALAQAVTMGHKALAGNYNYWVSQPQGNCSTLSAQPADTLYLLAVPGLRPRPMAQFPAGPVVGELLAIRRLLLAAEELAADVLVRPAARRASRQRTPRPRRRGSHLGRTDGCGQPRSNGVATRSSGGRSAVERPKGR